MKIKSLALLSLLLILATGCRNDEYDGLLNVDGYPALAVTFPDATVDGFTFMDDNSFIVNQNSIAAGELTLKIKGPKTKQIKSLEIKAQRFRSAIVWPNISPSVPTSATLRAPSAFSRTAASNLGTVEVTPASEVTYKISLASLPASLVNATLGATVLAPTGGTPMYEVFRFFILVRYTDDTSVLSNEVRVVVKG